MQIKCSELAEKIYEDTKEFDRSEVLEAISECGARIITEEAKGLSSKEREKVLNFIRFMQWDRARKERVK